MSYRGWISTVVVTVLLALFVPVIGTPAASAQDDGSVEARRRELLRQYQAARGDVERRRQILAQLEQLNATEPAGDEDLALDRTLRRGSRGEDVQRLQRFLGIEDDGVYGPGTERAVEDWQRRNGLDDDGVVGRRTREAMNEAATRGPVDLGNSTLREGSRGDDVRELQRFLGTPDDGIFGPGTKRAVEEWQREHGLDADGVVGRDTRAAMEAASRGEDVPGGDRPTEPVEDEPATPDRPDEPDVPTNGDDGNPAWEPQGVLRSPHHDDDLFVPRYPATAFSESSVMREAGDPYGVGGFSNPTRSQDLGGKSYGTYQFESSTYRDGSNRGTRSVNNSTLMRFIRWDDNPYGDELQRAVDEHGVASAGFDRVWQDIAARDNAGFGRAQEGFVEHENEAAVESWFNRAGVTAEARQDPRLYDLVMGSRNQYGGLVNGQADAVARAQAAAGRPLTAEEIGIAVQDHKAANVETNFRSSPGAWAGVRNRIRRERAMFE